METFRALIIETESAESRGCIRTAHRLTFRRICSEGIPQPGRTCVKRSIGNDISPGVNKIIDETIENFISPVCRAVCSDVCSRAWLGAVRLFRRKNSASRVHFAPAAMLYRNLAKNLPRRDTVYFARTAVLLVEV